MTSADGRFGALVMTAAMRAVADRIGLSCDDVRLLQMTNNATFAFPSARIVVRITRSHQLLARAQKVVDLARWFEESDAPAIRLAPGIAQPIPVHGVAATVWRYLPQTPPLPGVADLGTALREIHSLDRPAFELPRWDPVDDARRRLRDAQYLSDDDRDLIVRWCDRLAPRIDELIRTSPLRLVHADAHVGNLLKQADGRVVLCDFDASCLGPWQADLAPTAVGEIRFGRTGASRQLAAAYGHDVTGDTCWPLLREARELKMIAAATPFLDGGPAMVAEFKLRLRSAVTGDDEASWTPFADLT